MVKSKKDGFENEGSKERKNKNRLKSVRSDFNAGSIDSFQQIYDVVAVSWIATKLGMGFTTLKNKSASPGDFTLNEIQRYADLIGIDFEDLLLFVKVRRGRPKHRTKKRKS
ncbi:MAG TPA: hypothetical protein VMR70_01015 [Flavisolibacter sp.]|nr:hypothetical protein [Flavisolibacter sp.]